MNLVSQTEFTTDDTPFAGGGLFLDRDGTLNVDSHHLHDPAKLELIPGTRQALQHARAIGFRLFLFTNQSGIGRGLFTLEDALACNRRLVELIDLGDPLFQQVCIAPETPDEPALYRKPSPRFIQEAIAAHNLKPELCYMVGDRWSDWQAGLNAGIHPVAVRTGKAIEGEAAATTTSLQIPIFDSLLHWIEKLKPIGRAST